MDEHQAPLGDGFGLDSGAGGSHLRDGSREGFSSGTSSAVVGWLRSSEVSEALAAHVLEGDDYVVLLDCDLRIVEANDSFRRNVCEGCAPESRRFAEMLTEASRARFSALLDAGPANDRRPAAASAELCHSVSGGDRSVRYWALLAGPHRLLVGRDESALREISSQVSALGAEIAGESAPAGADDGSGHAPGKPQLLDAAAFARTVEDAAGALRGGGTGFSLIALDIDGFRQINDVYGYPAGDLVIARVAQILQESIRESDVVARVGGEEFMVLLPGLTAGEALEVAERLRAAVELTRMPDQVPRITISVGVASATPGSLVTGSEATALADRALQRAKDGGRNCVRSTE